MGVYFGQSGEIALKRDALQSALQTKLDPSDVNTATKTTPSGGMPMVKDNASSVTSLGH